MINKLQQKFSALALAILGLALLAWIWDGKVADYIAPQMIVLLFPTGLICIVLAQVVLSAAGKEYETASQPSPEQDEDATQGKRQAGLGLLWLALPLVIGLLFP